MAALVLNSVVALSIESRKTARTRFGSVHVARAGRGKFDLVVVTPMGSAWMERALPAELGEPFTIHVAELPGTGGSDASSAPEAASVAGVVAAISDISSAVASSTPVLFGHSMNGTLVLAAAAEVGCRGVVAVAPPPQLPPDSNVVARYWEAKAERSRRERVQALVEQYEATSDEAEKADLRQRFDQLRRWCDLGFDSTEFDSLASMPTGWVASVSESGTSIPWNEILAGLDVPVFLALGEYDFVAPMTAWTHDNTPPQATVKVFHRSGHTPFVEEPEEFVAAAAEWAQQLDERVPQEGHQTIRVAIEDGRPSRTSGPQPRTGRSEAGDKGCDWPLTTCGTSVASLNIGWSCGRTTGAVVEPPFWAAPSRTVGGMMSCVLVVVSGLPGCGKSALADALGRELGAAVLSVDPIEAAIWRSGIPASFETGLAAYEVAAVLAEHQLTLELSVIVDSVSSLEVAREMWRQAATRAGSEMRVIEVTCSDEGVHRQRLVDRRRGIVGFPEPSWEDVQRRRAEWEPWTEDRLVVDTTRPLDANIVEAIGYLRP